MHRPTEYDTDKTPIAKNSQHNVKLKTVIH